MFKAQDITNIEFEITYVTIDVTVYFNHNADKILFSIEKDFSTADKFEKDVRKMKDFYNALLKAWVSSELTNRVEDCIFQVTIDTSNKRYTPTKWDWYSKMEWEDVLLFPKSKKYNVTIGYDTAVCLEVEAENEEEAYKKARDIANNPTNEDVNGQLLDGASETSHNVEQID